MRDTKKGSVCVFTIHPAKNLRVFNRQCCSLEKNGWDVTLIAISEQGNYVENGVKVIGIRKWKSVWQRLKTLFGIAYKAYKQKADIYHFHDPDLLIPAVFLRILRRKPVIYDIHEFCHLYVPLRLPNIWPIRQIASVFLWSVETITGTLCGNISAVYEEHIKRFSRLGCRTVHTPNYASIEDFEPIPVSEKEWRQRHKRVIFTGTLTPVRGAFVLLDIAREVRKRRQDIEFSITRQFQAKFQEDAVMKKMVLPEYQDIIKFAPVVGGKELAAVVRRGGVALSLGQDTIMDRTGVPAKLFEYMSQAVPIVASNLPHSRKYVRDEGCGILVKPDAPEEYADAIIKLVDNLDLAMEMGRKGQKAFAEKYNWSFVEKRLVEFYESIS